MSHILLARELGMNLGHKARLLPVAKKLKECGPAVLIAARDLGSTATVLDLLAFPSFRRPICRKAFFCLTVPVSGYADKATKKQILTISLYRGVAQTVLGSFYIFQIK